jgi:hypothetical protein
MELLDRYLQAVKFWLPKEQKQDIIAELSEDVRSQIEEKEGELGRDLSEAEVVAILKQVGSPLFVATRFLPQQYLIGPLLFPIYRFVLKILALCYLIPWVLVWIGFMIFSQSYRAEHYSRGLIATVGSLWSPVWFGAFIATGVVTIVFAVLERTHAQTGFLENWDPRKLPAVRDPNRIPRSNSVTELIVGVLFIVWWVDAFWSRTMFRLPALQITLAPVWRYFFWGFLFVSVVNIALAAENLSRPYWTRLSASIRLASDGAGSILFCWLLRANVLAVITVPNVAAAKTLAITNAINLWDSSKIFPAAVIFCVAIAAFDIYRIIRVKGGVGPLTPLSAAQVNLR